MEAAEDIMKRNKITAVIMEVQSLFADVKNLELFTFKKPVSGLKSWHRFLELKNQYYGFSLVF